MQTLSVKSFQIARLSELAERQTINFQFERDGRKRDGFVARFAGEIVAYENVCRHIGINLDREGGQIFSRDGKHFVCQTHGATYEPLSGLCVLGPCKGERLKKLKIEISEETIWFPET